MVDYSISFLFTKSACCYFVNVFGSGCTIYGSLCHVYFTFPRTLNKSEGVLGLEKKFS